MVIFLLGLVIAAGLTAYALLAGADYGGGVWDLLAHGRTAKGQRATIARAIGPVWEANHVWLILVVTVLFTAFPPAYGWLGRHLHTPLTLALLGIVLRGSAFVFRAYGPRDEKDGWGWVFAGASAGTPILLGLVVGAITEGRTDVTWRSPFAVSVGFLTLTLFAYLAAVYLTLEAKDEDVAEAFRMRALGAAGLTGVMAGVTFVVARGAPHVREALTSSRWAIPLHTATAAAAIAAILALWTRRYWWARTAAIAQVSLIVWGWALAQWPFLIRPSMTFESAAAPLATQILLLRILAVGAVVLLPSLVYLFRIFGPREGHGG